MKKTILIAGIIFSHLIIDTHAQPGTEAHISINVAQVEGEISPMLYGQFAEFMYEDIKGGLHAELLRNRGFEEAPNAIGLSRYWERYPDDRNDDYGLAFQWDDSVAYPVSHDFFEEMPIQHALRINVGGGVMERHGLYQPRLPVRAGITYQGYLWMKTNGYEGSVAVALEEDMSGGKIYAETEIKNIEGDWKKYAFELPLAQTDAQGRLAILLNGRGQLWIDQVSLMPGDAVGEVRKDVLDKVVALRPSFIRWPGGNVAQDYHWMWGIGPRDQRPVWTNLSWHNEPEPSDFGTDEFIAFCKQIGAEPSITVNLEGRGATPEEATAWIEYCNGSATSKYGAMRVANGHPEPYNVRYWEIGNEIWGDWVRGHSDAATYARNYIRYYEAMHAKDSTIRFIAVGDNNMDWNRTVLRIAGPYIEDLAIHHYYGHDDGMRENPNLMARPLYYEQFYQQVAQLIREEVPGRSIHLNINEWGLDLPESRQYAMEAALYGARLMHVFERSSPLVAMSAVSDLINGWPGGIIQASRHGVFVSPLYHVNQLYNEYLGKSRLQTKVDGPTFDTSQEGSNIPSIDAVASRSADGKHIYLKIINTDPENAIHTRIDLSGIKVENKAEWHLLTADDLATHNSFATPDAIVPRHETIQAGSNFQMHLPRHSVSVIVLQVVSL